MTRSKHFKALVRARMARTGEVYTAARDGLLAELETVQLQLVETVQAHDKHCMALRFTPNGSELLTGGFGGQARIWSTRDWSRVGELVGHTSSVNGFGLDGLGGAITVSSDGSVRLWDVPTRSQRQVLSTRGKVGLGVDIRRDGRLAATGAANVVQFHRLDHAPGGAGDADGQAPPSLDLDGRVTAVAFDPVGERLAIGTIGDGVVIAGPDVAVARRLEGIDPANNARWSPDGAFLVVTSGEGVVAVFETTGWSEVRRVETGGGGMLPVAISPDGRVVAIGWEHHVGLWRALEDEPVVTMDGLPKGVYALDFSPDGRLLAQGGADGRVRIWRVRAG